jgi:hypothetical protein
MAFDADNGIVLDVNPYFAIKQILVSPFGNRLRDERTVRPELLLTNQVEGVVGGGDGAIVLILAGCCCDLTSN